MSGIDWTAIENGLHAVVVAATSLPPERVIWSSQSGPRPQAPYLAMHVTNLRTVGRDWTDYENNTDPEGPALISITRGMRAATLSIQCFADDATGDDSALGIVSRLMSRSKLPSVRAHLESANVSLAGFSTANAIGGAVGSQLEPRAVVEATLNLTSEVRDFEHAIERVEVTNLNTGATTEVELGSDD